ncbi:MAG: hypothetical protein ACI9EW_001670, partial [Cellvibrionaceae bacterium]
KVTIMALWEFMWCQSPEFPKSQKKEPVGYQ